MQEAFSPKPRLRRRSKSRNIVAIPIFLISTLAVLLLLAMGEYRKSAPLFNRIYGGALNLTASPLTLGRDLRLLRFALGIEDTLKEYATQILTVIEADHAAAAFGRSSNRKSTSPLVTGNLLVPRIRDTLQLWDDEDIDTAIRFNSQVHAARVDTFDNYEGHWIARAAQYKYPAPLHDVMSRSALDALDDAAFQSYYEVARVLVHLHSSLGDSITPVRSRSLLEELRRPSVTPVAFAYSAIRLPTYFIQPHSPSDAILATFAKRQVDTLRAQWEDRYINVANQPRPEALLRTPNASVWRAPYVFIGYPSSRLTPGYNAVEREWFQRGIANTAPWSHIYKDVATDISVLTCSMPIRDPHNHAYVGVLALDLFPAQLLTVTTPEVPLMLNWLLLLTACIALYAILYANDYLVRHDITLILYALLGLYLFYAVKVAEWLVNPTTALARDVWAVVTAAVSILNSFMFIAAAVVALNALGRAEQQSFVPQFKKLDAFLRERGWVAPIVATALAILGWLLQTVFSKRSLSETSGGPPIREIIDVSLSVLAVGVFGWRFGGWVGRVSRWYVGMVIGFVFASYAFLQLFQYVYKDSPQFWWVMLAGKGIWVAVVVISIYVWAQGRRFDERSLSELHLRVLRSLGNVTSGIAMAARGKSEVLFCNDYAAETLGWKADEFEDSAYGEGFIKPKSDKYPLGSIYAEDEHQRIVFKFRSIPVEGGQKRITNVRTKLRRRDGGECNVLLNAIAWKGEDAERREVWYSVGIATPVKSIE